MSEMSEWLLTGLRNIASMLRLGEDELDRAEVVVERERGLDVPAQKLTARTARSERHRASTPLLTERRAGTVTGAAT